MVKIYFKIIYINILTNNIKYINIVNIYKEVRFMGKNKYEDLYENIINGTYNYEEEQQKREQNRNMFYLIRELNANPAMLENVKKMMDYRDLRTK